MAKLTGPSSLGGIRAQAFKMGLTLSFWRGKPVLRVHAGTKRKKLSAKQKEAMIQFTALAQVAKHACDADIESAKIMSHGTQFLWRDLLYMAAAGRMFYFQLPNNQKMYSMAARTTTSDILDVVGQTPGAILYRGPDFWDILMPGPAGNILTSHGPNEAPSWAPNTPAGSGRMLATSQGSTVSTSNFASKGGIYEALVDLQITQVMPKCDYISGGEYRVRIYSMTGNTVVALLADSATWTAPSSGIRYQLFDLTSIATIPAGTRFWICLSRTDSLGTTPCRGLVGTTGQNGFPEAIDTASCALAQINPAPGHVVTPAVSVANYSFFYSA